MKSEEMFLGFSVGSGKDRFDERIQLGGEPHDCKVSGRDTMAQCAFSNSRRRRRAAPPPPRPG